MYFFTIFTDEDWQKLADTAIHYSLLLYIPLCITTVIVVLVENLAYQKFLIQLK